MKEIRIPSSLDGSLEPALFHEAAGTKRPLLVGLHTWSHDRFNQVENMLPLAGDYYQGTIGWAEARTNWWNMLQEVGASDGSIEAITEIVNARCDMANGK